jgi:outer membrane protein assembly factor BamB
MALDDAAAALAGDNSRAFVVSDAGVLLAIDPRAKAVQWRREIATRSAPRCSVLGQALLVTDERGAVVCVDTKSGDTRWERHLDGELLGDPLRAGDAVWLTTRTHLLRFDLTTGEQTASTSSGADEWTGPSIGLQGRLLTPMRNDVQVLDAADGTPLYRIRAGKRSRLYGVGSAAWLMESDRTVRVFETLR